MPSIPLTTVLHVIRTGSTVESRITAASTDDAITTAINGERAGIFRALKISGPNPLNENELRERIEED